MRGNSSSIILTFSCKTNFFFQLLADTETAQIGALVLICQVAVAVAVTVYVIRRSKLELEASLQRELAGKKAITENTKLIGLKEVKTEGL